MPEEINFVICSELPHKSRACTSSQYSLCVPCGLNKEGDMCGNTPGLSSVYDKAGL